MKKLHLIVLILSSLLLSIWFLKKSSTSIYVGDYSGNTRYIFDIKVKIDNKEVLNDSLTNSFPFSINLVSKENLRYGSHKVRVYSSRANVNQEKKIFLLPNQAIFIEFFPADTLTFSRYNFPDSVIINGTPLTDSLIELYRIPPTYYNPIFQDTLNIPIINEESRFDIRTVFKPIRLE